MPWGILRVFFAQEMTSVSEELRKASQEVPGASLVKSFFFCLLIFCMRRHMWNKVWFVASWWYLTYCNCKYKVHYSHVNVMSLHYIITPYQFVMQTLRELASFHMISIYLCSWQGDRLDEARKVWSCRIKGCRKRVELLITTNVCEYLLTTQVDWSIR